MAGVSPLTPFTAETAERAAMLLAKTMRLNLAKPMRSFTGVYRRGENYWVYTRPGKFCRRCGGVIEMTYLGARPEQKRMVFWCPNCQI